MSFKSKISKIHYDTKAKGIFFDLLEFLSMFYGLAVGFRNFLYDKHILKSEKISAKVISVGNLTTGGVGKTPLVAKIVQYLINNGEKVAVLTRGYGGKLSNKKINLISDGVNIYYSALESGDEAYWHAINNPLSVVITCKDRVKAAKYASEELGCTVIILDDGFQYRRLYRDIDIVLIDSKLKFGNGHLLPAGPLRESEQAYKRVDRLVVVDKDFDKKNAQKVAYSYEKQTGLKVLICTTEPDYIYNIKSSEKLASGEAVNAMCAIGQPEQFFRFLSDKYEIIKKFVFDDHHIYKQSEIDSIKGIIVTTEKDAVKLSQFKRKDIYAMKLKIDIDIDELLAD